MKKKNKQYHQRQSSQQIEPWKQESSHLPQRFLRVAKPNKKIFGYKNNLSSFLKLYKTDKFSAGCPHTRSVISPDDISEPINKTAFISCLNFSESDMAHMTSNLKLHLSCARLKQQTVLIARKRTKRGLEIKSLKKRILNSQCVSRPQQQNQSCNQSQTRQRRMRLKTEGKLRAHTLQIESSSCFDSLVKKVDLKDKIKKDNESFVSQIAAILNEKNRIVQQNKQNQFKFNKPMQIQDRSADFGKNIKLDRQLFLKRNQKFKSWFESSRKVFFSSLAPKNSDK